MPISNEWIEYTDYNTGNLVRTNMYTLEEAQNRMAWHRERKLNTAVDKRTRFYKRMVELNLIHDGQTIYNRDVEFLVI